MLRTGFEAESSPNLLVFSNAEMQLRVVCDYHLFVNEAKNCNFFRIFSIDFPDYTLFRNTAELVNLVYELGRLVLFQENEGLHLSLRQYYLFFIWLVCKSELASFYFRQMSVDHRKEVLFSMEEVKRNEKGEKRRIGLVALPKIVRQNFAFHTEFYNFYTFDDFASLDLDDLVIQANSRSLFEVELKSISRLLKLSERGEK